MKFKFQGILDELDVRTVKWKAFREPHDNPSTEPERWQGVLEKGLFLPEGSRERHIQKY